MATAPTTHNAASTLWAGNLPLDITEALVYELFVVAGPINSITLPRDRLTHDHANYAFVEYVNAADADYALRIFHNVKLYGKPIRLNRVLKGSENADADTPTVHAKLFIGHLHESIDEKVLHDTFIQFGAVISARIMIDPDTGVSRGHGFITYDSFAAADRAVEAMNGEYLGGQTITVSYALKKVGGGRHGSPEERALEQQMLKRKGIVEIKPMANVTKNPHIVPPPPPPVPGTTGHIPPIAPFPGMPPPMPYYMPFPPGYPPPPQGYPPYFMPPTTFPGYPFPMPPMPPPATQ